MVAAPSPVYRWFIVVLYWVCIGRVGALRALLSLVAAILRWAHEVSSWLSDPLGFRSLRATSVRGWRRIAVEMGPEGRSNVVGLYMVCCWTFAGPAFFVGVFVC